MGAGHWLNPLTGQCLQVTTHDTWIRIQANAELIGLPDDLYCQITALPDTAIDPIRILALQGGLVRIRQHRWYTSVQFWTAAEELLGVLQAVEKTLYDLQIHPDERLIIDNLLLGESIVVFLRDLGNQRVSLVRAF